MARAKAMTYEEFMEYSKKYYTRGGDSFYECWDERDFDEYVKNWGGITKSKALAMFRENLDVERDMAGWY